MNKLILLLSCILTSSSLYCMNIASLCRNEEKVQKSTIIPLNFYHLVPNGNLSDEDKNLDAVHQYQLEEIMKSAAQLYATEQALRNAQQQQIANRAQLTQADPTMPSDPFKGCVPGNQLQARAQKLSGKLEKMKIN